MNELKTVQQHWDEYPCGIEITDKEVGTREFFDDIQRKFESVYAVYSHSDRLLNFNGYSGKNVLEAGCGLGFDALKYAKGGANVTAIDLSPRNVELARRLFSYHGQEGRIELANAESLPYEDNSFDLVVSIGVLYYTPDTQRAVNEVERVLKPGGKTICMFFNRYSWYVALARLFRTGIDSAKKDAPVLKLYSARQVRQMFSRFFQVEIEMDRFPNKSIKRSGILAQTYNMTLVPVCRVMPRAILRPIGFHIIVKATKSA